MHLNPLNTVFHLKMLLDEREVIQSSELSVCDLISKLYNEFITNEDA